MKQEPGTLPCALCGRLLEQRADKNNKPYFVCEQCGTQFFVRGAAGRERLVLLLESRDSHAMKNAGRQRLSAPEQKALSDDLNMLQTYIETFCEEQLILPGEPYEVENAVPFPKWSGDVCDRISKVINQFVKP